jgi:hypothetical protein
VDASYGSSTYQDIDLDNVYYVYRTPTGIITRSEPRLSSAEPRGEALAIDVTAACGAETPLWERLAVWTDARARDLLR